MVNLSTALEYQTISDLAKNETYNCTGRISLVMSSSTQLLYLLNIDLVAIVLVDANPETHPLRQRRKEIKMYRPILHIFLPIISCRFMVTISVREAFLKLVCLVALAVYSGEIQSANVTRAIVK
jgi:hypothetical protein